MNRKRFIQLAATSAVVISIPVVYSCSKKVKYNPKLAEPTSLLLIWDGERIKGIGQKYLTQVPGEKEERTLVTLLSNDLSLSQADGFSILESKVKQDFEVGLTVVVDGWILSVTEARQCALYSFQ